MTTSPLNALAARLESVEALDGPGRTAGGAVRGLISDGALKDVLSGAWLGHAVHPILTDIPIGAWTSSVLLDWIGGKGSRSASDLWTGRRRGEAEKGLQTPDTRIMIASRGPESGSSKPNMLGFMGCSLKLFLPSRDPFGTARAVPSRAYRLARGGTPRGSGQRPHLSQESPAGRSLDGQTARCRTRSFGVR